MTTTRRINFDRSRRALRAAINQRPNDHLAAALEDLDLVAGSFDAAVQRIHDARRGTPGAQSYNGNGSGSHGNTSTVESALGITDREAGVGDQLPGPKYPTQDPAVTELHRLDRALREIEVQSGQAHRNAVWIARHARTVYRIVTANSPKAPTARQRAQVEGDNRRGSDECAITRELAGRYEPVHRVSDCGGILPEPVPLGRWVYDFVRRLGRKPTKGEMERHHQGRTIRVPA